jgi:hypothetical protein
MEKIHFSTNKLFNVDETSISVAIQNVKGMSLKGKRQFVKLSSAESGI